MKLRDEITRRKREIVAAKTESYLLVKEAAMQALTEEEKMYFEMACEKGASAWLVTLPLEECGFALNKQEFRDAVSLRYGHQIRGVAKTCACGAENSLNHCLICKKGGYVSMRHNSLRDTIASTLSDVTKDVIVEPELLPVGDIQLPSSSNVSENARSDISARNFWFPMGRSFFDIRVLHPGSPSNSRLEVTQMYTQHENEKKRQYNERIIQIEKGTFTPLVFSTHRRNERRN